MPELPEVETIKRGLERLIVGKTVRRVTHDWAKSWQASENDVAAFLIGATVTSVERRAKVLLVGLDNDYTLLVHLKMTGQLVYIGDERFGAGHPTNSLLGNLPDKSTRVTFEFQDDTRLYFNDQRKFGWIKLLPTSEINSLPFFVKVGPEPLDPNLTTAEFTARFARRARSPIKAALLDQSIIAGVGNIYADEALWGAKVHPATKVESLHKADFKNIFSSLKEVLQLSIDKGGSTDKNYIGASGEKGSYLAFANVFRREGQACSRCGTEILKTRVAGRGTHTCPHCQIETTA